MSKAFNKDLIVGENIERDFGELLKKINRHRIIEFTTGKDSSHDVRGCDMQGSLWTTYEVKHQRKHKKTGNFAIEFSYKGNPSGLSVTQADYWVESTEDAWYIFKAQELRDWLGMNKDHLKVVEGGDDNQSKLILIKSPLLTNRGFCEQINK